MPNHGTPGVSTDVVTTTEATVTELQRRGKGRHCRIVKDECSTNKLSHIGHLDVTLAATTGYVHFRLEFKTSAGALVWGVIDRPVGQAGRRVCPYVSCPNPAGSCRVCSGIRQVGGARRRQQR